MALLEPLVGDWMHCNGSCDLQVRRHSNQESDEDVTSGRSNDWWFWICRCELLDHAECKERHSCSSSSCIASKHLEVSNDLEQRY